MAITLSVALCLACGVALVSIGLRRVYGLNLLFLASVSVGFGVGICSCIFFVWRLLGSRHLLILDWVALGLLLALYFLLARPKMQPIAGPPRLTSVHKNECRPCGNGVDSQQTPDPFPDEGGRGSIRAFRGFHIPTSIALVCALAVAVYAAIVRTIAFPQGEGWDAFAIWNLRARFLFLGGTDHWRDGFTQLLSGSHPDYPLLLPAATAHFWTCLGHDSPAVPAVIGLAFTFGTVGILFSALRMLRGPMPAMLGTLLLLCTPAFIAQGTSQYADVSLAFFIAVVMAALAIHEEWSFPGQQGMAVLAGIAAGFAAWTKNEGLLFAGALLVVSFVQSVRKNHSDPFLPLLAGSLPLLLLTFAYKHWIAGPGDLFSSPAVMAGRLLQPRRYGIVLEWFAKDFFRFGGWFVVPGTIILLAFCFFWPGDPTLPNRTREECGNLSVWALGLTLVGYFFIYLITPYDLYWHLRFSLDRLFLQLWPGAILLVFRAVPASQFKPRSRAECGNVRS
jgi:hypothetical protein